MLDNASAAAGSPQQRPKRIVYTAWMVHEARSKHPSLRSSSKIVNPANGYF